MVPGTLGQSRLEWVSQDEKANKTAPQNMRAANAKNARPYRFELLAFKIILAAPTAQTGSFDLDAGVFHDFPPDLDLFPDSRQELIGRAAGGRQAVALEL